MHLSSLTIRSVCAFLLLHLSIPASCLGADSLLNEEIAAYNHGDFHQVVTVGKQLLSKDPGNEYAHYYLANAYAQLRQTEDAIAEYSACSKFAKDPKIRSYAEKALQALAAIENNTAPRAQAQPEVPTADLRKIQSQAAEGLGRLQRVRFEQDQTQSEELKHEVERIRNDERDAIGAVPRYSLDYRNHRVANPDYTTSVERIRLDANEKINALESEFEKKKRWADEEFQRKSADMTSSPESTASQLQPGKSDIQLTPVGSNLNVRNYVNYGGDYEPPPPPPVEGLKAVAKPLQKK